ncbi:MAG TPA: hypothetical protein VI546_05240 [candidate division Zixibacteria bacterium]|nr:hypothetical protein [candidate division Zixibacteria bacterium]
MLKLPNLLIDTKGFSIVEVLIGAFIISIVCAFALQAFVGQKAASNMQEQVSEAQQAATFSLTELTVAVRNAGFGVPTGAPRYAVRIGTLGHDTLIIYSNNGVSTDSTRYFLDHTTDAAHPTLKRRKNVVAAEVFAENIEDVDFFPLGAPVKSITVSITARTEDIDKHLNDYRRRTVSSNIVMANASF